VLLLLLQVDCAGEQVCFCIKMSKRCCTFNINNNKNETREKSKTKAKQKQQEIIYNEV